MHAKGRHPPHLFRLDLQHETCRTKGETPAIGRKRGMGELIRWRTCDPLLDCMRGVW
jgi:hypothetical protein